MHAAGDYGCEEGGCLGEPIEFDRKWPTMTDCHNKGGKCCAVNKHGAAPWAYIKTMLRVTVGIASVSWELVRQDSPNSYHTILGNKM